MGRTLTDPLVERMRGFGTTIFAEMTALAQQTGAVNLGQGFPDTEGPASMLEVARSAIASGHNQYPPGSGIRELRTAVAEHQAARYDLSYDPDTEVLITAARECGGRVLTVEDHYAHGGLGDAVLAALAPQRVAVTKLAVDEIPHSGKPKELLERYGISRKHIVETVRQILGGTGK